MSLITRIAKGFGILNFEMDANFNRLNQKLERSQNLGDLADKPKGRQDLGLTSLALEDVDNLILSGFNGWGTPVEINTGSSQHLINNGFYKIGPNVSHRPTAALGWLYVNNGRQYYIDTNGNGYFKNNIAESWLTDLVQFDTSILSALSNAVGFPTFKESDMFLHFMTQSFTKKFGSSSGFTSSVSFQSQPAYVKKARTGTQSSFAPATQRIFNFDNLGYLSFFFAVSKQNTVYGFSRIAFRVANSLPGNYLATDTRTPVANRFWGAVTSFLGDAVYGVPCSETSVVKVNTTNDAVTYIGNYPGTQKWRGASLAINNRIYCAPFNHDNVLVIRTDEDTVYTIGTVIPGEGKYSGNVLGPNGKIYCIPYNATQIMVIDPLTDSVSFFGDFPGTAKYSGGALGPDGKIYCMPYNATGVMVINPLFNEAIISGDQTGYENALLIEHNKIIGFAATPNKKALEITFNASNYNHCLVVSPWLNKC